MVRAPKATWTRPAKGTAVPIAREFGAVRAECSAATYADRPVAGVLSIIELVRIVLSTSSTSSAAFACRRMPARRKVEVPAEPCK